MHSQRQGAGTLVISLDFELFWGMFDRSTVERYGESVIGVQAVVPRLLDLFARYEIHATWATVGFLFFETRSQLLQALPSVQPDYVNTALSPYRYLDQIGDGEKDDPYHYAPSLLEKILASPHQEVGSHTFSHYYCLERGQDTAAFRADLAAAIQAAARYNIRLETLIFPRNQFNAEYLSVCREMGIRAYRGTESSWIYEARNAEQEQQFRRGVRLADAYLNLSSHHGHTMEKMAQAYPFDIPSSRFLRPYSRRLARLEPLRLRRIKDDLTYAAKRGLMYHLWWHPHNFGANMDANMAFLTKILDHYATLRERYGMESLNMVEMADRLDSAVDTNIVIH